VAALSMHDGEVVDALRAVLPTFEGAYSIAVASGGEIYAARDPFGFRPLCLGRFDSGGWVIASETIAIDSVGARFVRDIAPGELVTIDARGIHAERLAVPQPRPCVFEHVYFARPDSAIGGVRVTDARNAMGVALAGEAPSSASIVVPVLETGRAAAVGYAKASGIPYVEGLVRDSRVGRTFIMSEAADRGEAVRRKLSPVPELIAGQRVALVDDSLVRANSARIVVAMLRAAGAAEVHLRVASPPVRWPCFFGVDIDGELPARRNSISQITRLVDADSLGYLSVESLIRAAGGGPVCAGCFTGEYPVRVPFSETCRSVGASTRLSVPDLAYPVGVSSTRMDCVGHNSAASRTSSISSVAGCSHSTITRPSTGS
jgi:amidophosphoribosyltransferase